MSHELESLTPIRVGNWPDFEQITELRIHEFAFTDFNPREQKALVSIVVQDPQERFQHPTDGEASAADLAFMREVLHLRFPDGETLAEKLLERVREHVDPTTGRKLFESYTVAPLPPEPAPMVVRVETSGTLTVR